MKVCALERQQLRSRQWTRPPGVPLSMESALIDMHPVRRLGTPEDVARAALFLASEESAWITGVILDVTGGAVMVS